MLDAVQSESKANGASSIFDFTVEDIEGKDYPLEQIRDKVALIVNVASA